MTPQSLLDRLEKLCNVDVDDPSTDVIRGLPFTPHNQTSNHAFITNEMIKPENSALLKELTLKYGSQGWEKVYDMAGVCLCARNVPYISGRVLLQISLRYVNDKEAMIRSCRSLAAAFEEQGVSRDRFAFKLPFSGSAASAARELNAEGLRTLATAVFSLEQELAAHLDASLRRDYNDTALEVLEAYTKAYAETGKEQPIMIIASHFTSNEIMAMAELGCQHVTISAPCLQALMETPDTLPPVTTPKPEHPYASLTTPERLKALSKKDELAGPEWDGVLANMDTDFVANGGAKLDEFLGTNAVAKKRFADATKFFLEMEEKGKKAIEEHMKALGVEEKN